MTTRDFACHYDGGVMQKVLFTAAALLIAASGASADTLVLKDGRTLNGKVERIANGWKLSQENGQFQTFRTDEVRTLSFDRTPTSKPATTGPATTAPATAAQIPVSSLAGRWGTLKRSSDNLEDPKKAIERYQAFLKQTTDPEYTKLAQAEIDSWQKRLDEKMLRYNGQWVTPMQRDEALIESVRAVDRVRTLIKARALADAAAACDAILKADPTVPGALYLKAVLDYREGNVPIARKGFEQVVAVLPDHVPSLYNNGLMLLLQDRRPAASALFESAIEKQPGNQFLLDNLVEGINLLTRGNPAPSPQFTRLATRFNEQEKQLRQAMLEKQLYRWGSDWVGRAKFEEIDAKQRDAKMKLDDLKRQYDETEAAIARQDRELTEIDRILRQIELKTLATDGRGNTVRLPLPPSFYEYQRQQAEQKRLRDDNASKLNGYRAEAQKLKETVLDPPYKGAMEPIAEDGVPVVLPANVTLQQALNPRFKLSDPSTYDLPALPPSAAPVIPKPQPPVVVPATQPAAPQVSGPEPEGPPMDDLPNIAPPSSAPAERPAPTEPPAAPTSRPRTVPPLLRAPTN